MHYDNANEVTEEDVHRLLMKKQEELYSFVNINELINNQSGDQSANTNDVPNPLLLQLVLLKVLDLSEQLLLLVQPIRI